MDEFMLALLTLIIVILFLVYLDTGSLTILWISGFGCGVWLSRFADYVMEKQ